MLPLFLCSMEWAMPLANVDPDCLHFAETFFTRVKVAAESWWKKGAKSFALNDLREDWRHHKVFRLQLRLSDFNVEDPFHIRWGRCYSVD